MTIASREAAQQPPRRIVFGAARAAMTRRSERPWIAVRLYCSRVALRIGQEFGAAAGAAEIPGRAARLRRVARAGDGDAHAANRVPRLGRGLRPRFLARRLRAGAATLDDLRHDRERDLLGRARADVEAGGRGDALERLA